MADSSPDGIVKAWRAMDEGLSRLRAARKACREAARAIRDTTSAAGRPIASGWERRADMIADMIADVTGKPEKD